ncbi:acyl-CoA dehydrogenase [Acuticoccus sp. I52.16.1]|uniref:acyl-CoA dehydrogenase n=1 Tax=Acuticoccus sp. I52.16.1 TaxID=2928472 RepID=UPI001FD0AE9E|nr:acyl-CoA dehydrogenase [Acuticoccus sp. I52.16.1]UOM33336.1 acyl-CoA dehydrogenase [Acuticoccus sp. I52.16.1]
MTYTAAVEEMLFALEEVAGLAEAREAGAIDLGEDDARAILTEAGRFAEDELAPLNEIGDREHSRRDGHDVITPQGWAEAYRAWVDAGWGSLTGEEAYGGQGLPMALQIVLTDIVNQANAGFSLNPLLTVGAVEALQAHASDALKATYLPKMIAGEWAGTMNLTEPQAGSDLGTLKTRAEPEGDHYRLFGQKIFISYGEHDLTENIIHLVLARLPDAPEGTRGISLFLVPKFLVAEDGSLGARNDVACVGVEDKLGIHASPTCTMAYGDKGEGAIGYLVGQPGRGLNAMFTMMNQARVSVGMQGAAVAERATQRAVAFAMDRKQGATPSWTAGGPAPIAYHPDVKRMLLSMRGLTRAARAICYACAVAIDRGRPGKPDAAFWKARADLLTPIAKAFASDIGVEVSSLGIQVHGGMGYVEETGAAQHFRDARIFTIYEGTNGIQAIDLVRRKIVMQDGAVLAAYLKELRGIAEAARGANDLSLGEAGKQLEGAIDAVASAAAALAAALAAGEVDKALAGATPFLRAIGLTAGGAYLVKAALKAQEGAAPSRAGLARFFVDGFVTSVPALAANAVGGADDILAATPDILAA